MQNRHTVAVCALWLIGIASYSSAEPQELSLANGDRYEGEVIDGSLEGFGRYVWADGKSYEGNFAAGKREGFGSLTWVNGDRYRGNFVTGQMQGRGVFVWANGDRYEGSFVANQRDGQGTMQWQSGERYEGQFEAGMMNGQGLYQWPDGTRYKGTFVQDRRSGLGMLIDSDAATFSGYFFQGRRDGMGVERRGNGPLSLQQWQDGVLQEAQAIAVDPRCRADDADGAWMVRADACINGLAHGDGFAVTLTGEHLVTAGRWILGQRVKGERVALPEPPASPGQKNAAPAGPAITDTANNG